MNHSVALSALPTWLANETASRGDDVAVLAGHFAIMSAGNAAIDGLGDLPPPAGAAGMVEFTRATWRLACETAASNPALRFRMVVLVDDIQMVRPLVADRGSAERLAAAIAAQYLDTVRDLPAYHARELAGHGVAADRTLRRSAERALFSERELRRDVVHRLRTAVAGSNGNGASLATSDNGSTITAMVRGEGECSLVQSGHATCAGGYVELVSALYDRGIRKLVSLVPMRCLGQVALGTRLARALFPLDGLTVVNVAIGDTGATTSAVVDRQGTD
ncbi:MAG: hypothetical protein ABUL71_04640 [Gemmatimonadota bacterium]